MDMIVLCPTRGRPEAAREALASFEATKTLHETHLMFVIDDDDPVRYEYGADLGDRFLNVIQPGEGNMVKALNSAALWAIETLDPKYLGFIGDDHRFRTDGWDAHFTDILTDRGGGMVYGNDLNRVDGDIPTQIVMSADIVRALGWMGLPGCRHLYIDNAWRVIGDTIDRLFYMPDVVIEHLHPAFGRADWDEGHQRVNTSEMYDHDAEAFRAWVEGGDAAADVDRVRKALAL